VVSVVVRGRTDVVVTALIIATVVVSTLIVATLVVSTIVVSRRLVVIVPTRAVALALRLVAALTATLVVVPVPSGLATSAFTTLPGTVRGRNLNLKNLTLEIRSVHLANGVICLLGGLENL
jgi:hypothetical protein